MQNCNVDLFIFVKLYNLLIVIKLYNIMIILELLYKYNIIDK